MTISNTEIRRAHVGGELTPGKLAFKVLKCVLDFHIKLNGTDMALLPTGALEEIHMRLGTLRGLIEAKFQEADTELRRRGHSMTELPPEVSSD